MPLYKNKIVKWAVGIHSLAVPGDKPSKTASWRVLDMFQDVRCRVLYVWSIERVFGSAEFLRCASFSARTTSQRPANEIPTSPVSDGRNEWTPKVIPGFSVLVITCQNIWWLIHPLWVFSCQHKLFKMLFKIHVCLATLAQPLPNCSHPVTIGHRLTRSQLLTAAL